MKTRFNVSVEVVTSKCVNASDVDDMLSGALEALIAAGCELSGQHAKVVAFTINDINDINEGGE